MIIKSEAALAEKKKWEKMGKYVKYLLVFNFIKKYDFFKLIECVIGCGIDFISKI